MSDAAFRGLRDRLCFRGTPRCGTCGLVPSWCLCAALPIVQTRVRLVVVMHRNEVSKSTNTARLAVRMLPNSEVRVRGALPPDTRPLATGRAAVLFPEPGAPSVSELAGEQAPTLVVPDGSWSQARKLVRRDPGLAALPIVSLSPPEPTQYSLRRNGREGGLCTLEAIALALGALEGPSVEEALLGAFDLFVRTHHLARWGPRGGPPPERAR